MAAISHSLARANGRGLAGRAGLASRQCPASHAAKTPAAREPDAALRRSLGGCNRTGGDKLAGETAQLLLQLAELRDTARAYYAHSDLTKLSREGVEASDRLARLLDYPEQAA